MKDFNNDVYSIWMQNIASLKKNKEQILKLSKICLHKKTFKTKQKNTRRTHMQQDCYPLITCAESM